MNLRELILTKNNCYAAGAKLAPTGIMVHSTGANNPFLRRYIGPDDGLLGANAGDNHWNRPKPDGREVCVHAFIGRLADGSIAAYQTLPWDMRGWHGGGRSNDSHIGFEICEDGLTDPDYFAKIYKEAAELCAHLCKTCNIRPEKPHLICHSEAFALGIASNHADVMHWFPKHGKNMDDFRADVRAMLSEGASASGRPHRPAATPEELAVDGAISAGVITDRQYWLNVLAGKTVADKKYIQILMENAGKRAGRAAGKSAPQEDAVEGALSGGIITDRQYWLNVLAGKTNADKKYVMIMLENAGKNNIGNQTGKR